MRTKFILVNLETNESMEYKTLREIAETLKIEYFKIRELKSHSSNKPKKFMHLEQKLLSDKYKILDNLNI